MTNEEARTEQRVRGGASGQYHHCCLKEFPLPTTKEWGEGQGEGRPTCVLIAWTNPSPQPSPRSSLTGRGSDRARSLGTFKMRPVRSRRCVIWSSFVIWPLSFGFYQASPFHRRRPHSAIKQPSANTNTVERCHRGSVQLSVIGALRFGRFAAKLSSLAGAMSS